MGMTVFYFISLLDKIEHKSKDILVIDPDVESNWLDVEDVIDGPHGVMVKTSA
jgi:hypothetical protein